MTQSSRERMHVLIGVLRSLPEIPQPLFELLEIYAADIDARFAPHESPTAPRRGTVAYGSAGEAFVRAAQILTDEDDTCVR